MFILWVQLVNKYEHHTTTKILCQSKSTTRGCQFKTHLDLEKTSDVWLCNSISVSKTHELHTKDDDNCWFVGAASFFPFCTTDIDFFIYFFFFLLFLVCWVVGFFRSGFFFSFFFFFFTFYQQKVSSQVSSLITADFKSHLQTSLGGNLIWFSFSV